MKSEWSLSEAARLLGQPQHRLIYLCEKGVIVPDLGEARGRGSSRRFSSRNLLEFTVALSLRELTVPVGPVAAIIYALRAFERKVAAEIPGFSLADTLRKGRAPDLRIIVTDAGRLYFSLGSGGRRKVYGGLDLSTLTAVKRRRRRSKPSKEKAGLDVPILGKGRPAGEAKARIEVSVTQIASDLRFDG